MNDIDIVVYWVDGNDIEWQKKKAKYQGKSGQDFSPSRYRDWDNLQYLFRGIEKYAPWVRKVFFVSDGQIPIWMDTSCEKLQIVDHKDYIPEEYLPVFSSHPIELNFHRIKDLSEQFIVMNDDFYFTAPLKPTDFFADGKPVDILMEYPVMCGGNNPGFSDILANTFNVIGKYHERAKYKKALRGKMLSLKYGKYFFYNLLTYIIPYPRFYGVHTPHFARPYLKSVFKEVWEKEPAILEQASSHRFRDDRDVNVYLFRIWNLMKGNFVPGNIHKMGNAFFIHDKDEAVCRAIETQKYKLICINDDCDEDTFAYMKERVIEAFGTILPEKCSFEK